VDQQTQAFSLSKSVGGRTLYKIQASQVTNFKDTGKTVLHNVSIQLVGKDESREDHIISEECEFDQASGSLFMPGNVEMVFDASAARIDAKNPNASAAPSQAQFVHITTSALRFNQNTGIASTDHQVRLQFAGGEGSSTGAVYNPQDRTITMQAQARFTLWKQQADGSPVQEGKLQTGSDKPVTTAAQPDEDGATHLEASSLLFQSTEHKVFLTAPVVIRQGTREVRAGESEIFLNNQQRAERATLRGGVHGSDHDPQNLSELDALSAELEFTPQGKIRRLALESSAAAADQKNAQKSESSARGLPGRPAGLVAWVTASASSLKAGQARQVEMFFDESQGQLRRVAARGDVRVTLSPWTETAALPPLQNLFQDGRAAAPGSRSLQAQQAEMLMAPDGETLREVRTQSASTIQLIPSRPGEEKRTIQGETIHMQFSPEGDLSEFTADSGVRFNAEGTGPNPRKRGSSSDHLWASIDPRTHTVTELRQWGHFTYRDPDRQARSEQANYTAARDLMVLEGEPVVWNASGKLSAQKITLTNSTNEVHAEKQVSTTYYPSSEPGNPPPEPTHAVADRLDFNTRTELALYQGNARLWQGNDMIEAPWIELDRKQESLDARNGVFSVFPGREESPKKKASADGKPQPPAGGAAEGPIEIRSNTLAYKNKEQKARYAGDVRLQNPSATLRAQELEIFFTDPAPRKNLATPSPAAGQPGTPGGGRQIERALASGSVSIVQPGRKATGEHAEYIPTENKVILTGNLAAISDAEKGNTQGTRLTYFTRDDRIFVEGEPGTPAETRRPVQRGAQH
jgi:lipopolysaccharide export system protein LptA